MPYKDGNPTLGEQIEEDMRRRYYTDDLLKEANEMARENRLLRAFHDAWVEAEVASATGDPDLARAKRQALVAVHKLVRESR
jgi:hypothetical protein